MTLSDDPREAIRLARLGMGMSQAELARQLGLSRKCVWAYETGRKGPKRMVLLAVSMLLRDATERRPYKPVWGIR